MARYGRCIYCGEIVTMGYGQTQAQCPKCGAVYGFTETGSKGELFSPVGQSGEGWWFLGGLIFGLAIGWPVSRALLSSAIGLTRSEVERRAREVAEKAKAEIEARRRR